MSKHLCLIGIGSDIGQACARLALKLGYRVSGTYHRSVPLLPDVYLAQMNVTDEQSVTRGGEAIIAANGPIDVLVYLPTHPTPHTPFSRVTWADMDAHYTVQVKGLFFMAHHLVAQLKEHPFHLVVVATEYVNTKPPAGLTPYVTAKYGLVGLAQCLSVEWERLGSKVTVVSPGVTRTKLTAHLPGKLLEMLAEEKKLREPEDVAREIVSTLG